MLTVVISMQHCKLLISWSAAWRMQSRTQSCDEYENDDPINEVRRQNKERPQWLNEQQRDGRQAFAGFIEQSHNQWDATA